MWTNENRVATTARTSTLRLLPPRFAGGVNRPIRAHSNRIRGLDPAPPILRNVTRVLQSIVPAPSSCSVMTDRHGSAILHDVLRLHPTYSILVARPPHTSRVRSNDAVLSERLQTW